MSETMQKLLEKQPEKLKTLERGQFVIGKVIRNDGRSVLVDVGGKSEGIISRREIEEEKIDLSQFKLGDEIPVIINMSETDQGLTILSVKKAALEKQWQEASDAYKEDDILEGTITDINVGGVILKIGNLEGFIPTSHLNQEVFAKVKQFTNPNFKPSDRGLVKQDLMGEKLKVKVIEVDKKKNRLVVSQKAALAEKDKEKIKETLSKIKVGDEVSGKITNVAPFGIFIDIGDVEGLAHISELSWERVTHPAQMFTAGDSVKAKVTDVNPAEGKLSLSIKALSENPFQKFVKENKVGTKVEGEVVKIVPYGAFVKVSAGVDGFLHVSESTGPLKVGEKIEALIVELDEARKRISLSVKKAAAEKK